MLTYFPGTRVLVFDSRLYVDDKKTPINETLNMATVLCWYGTFRNHRYKSLIDVEFDHQPGQISHGHITTAVRVVESEAQAERAVREIATNAKLNEDQEFLLRKKLLQGVKT
jgi:hypothetical protein